MANGPVLACAEANGEKAACDVRCVEREQVSGRSAPAEQGRAPAGRGATLDSREDAGARQEHGRARA